MREVKSALKLLSTPVGQPKPALHVANSPPWRMIAILAGGMLVVGVMFAVWRFAPVQSVIADNHPVAIPPAKPPMIVSEPTVLMTAAGFIKADQLATVSAEVTGTVERIYVKRGNTVKKGDPIASLDNASLRSDLDAARMNLRIAQTSAGQARERLPLIQANFDRLTELTKWGAVSSQEVENVQSELTQRKAELQRFELEARYATIQIERRQIDLERATIRAPFNGMIVSLDASTGEIVSPVSSAGGFARTGIATLIDTDQYHAEVWVPEKSLDKLAERQAVSVMPDALTDVKVAGEVAYISPIVDEQRAAVLVLISMKSVPKPFKHNMSVHVDFL